MWCIVPRLNTCVRSVLHEPGHFYRGPFRKDSHSEFSFSKSDRTCAQSTTKTRWNASTGQWTYNAAAPAPYGAPAPLMATAAWGYTYCGPHQQQPPPPQFFPYAQPAVGSYYAPCPCVGVLPPWLVAPPVWSVHPGAIPVAPVVVVLPLLF